MSCHVLLEVPATSAVPVNCPEMESSCARPNASRKTPKTHGTPRCGISWEPFTGKAALGHGSQHSTSFGQTRTLATIPMYFLVGSEHYATLWHPANGKGPSAIWPSMTQADQVLCQTGNWPDVDLNLYKLPVCNEVRLLGDSLYLQ